MRELRALYAVAMLLTASFSGASLGGVAAAGNAPGDGGNADAFGQLVADFVHNLQAAGNTEGGLGSDVAEFVLEHNPAAAMIPEVAGPPGPGERGGPNAAASSGSSAGADDRPRGPPGDGGVGPPDERENGPPSSDRAAPGPPEESGPPDSSGGGPPASVSGDQTPTPTDSPDRSDGASSGGPPDDSGGPPDETGGPPDHAGEPPGNGHGPPG